MFIVDIEVACTNYEGVDAVKRALKKGLELSTESMPIKVGFGKCSQNLIRGWIKDTILASMLLIYTVKLCYLELDGSV